MGPKNKRHLLKVKAGKRKTVVKKSRYSVSMTLKRVNSNIENNRLSVRIVYAVSEHEAFGYAYELIQKDFKDYMLDMKVVVKL